MGDPRGAHGRRCPARRDTLVVEDPVQGSQDSHGRHGDDRQDHEQADQGSLGAHDAEYRCPPGAGPGDENQQGQYRFHSQGEPGHRARQPPRLVGHAQGHRARPRLGTPPSGSAETSTRFSFASERATFITGATLDVNGWPGHGLRGTSPERISIPTMSPLWIAASLRL